MAERYPARLFDGPGNAVEALAEAMFNALLPFGWVAPRPWPELDERQRSTWRARAERWISAEAAPGARIGVIGLLESLQPHQHRFDVVIRDDEHMRLLGCSIRLPGNHQCPEVYQWDR